jgi:hypothetical protein
MIWNWLFVWGFETWLHLALPMPVHHTRDVWHATPWWTVAPHCHGFILGSLCNCPVQLFLGFMGFNAAAAWCRNANMRQAGALAAMKH